MTPIGWVVVTGGLDGGWHGLCSGGRLLTREQAEEVADCRRTTRGAHDAGDEALAHPLWGSPTRIAALVLEDA